MLQNPLTYTAYNQYQNRRMLDMLPRRCLVITDCSVSSVQAFSAAGGAASASYKRLLSDRLLSDRLLSDRLLSDRLLSDRLLPDKAVSEQSSKQESSQLFLFISTFYAYLKEISAK